MDDGLILILGDEHNKAEIKRFLIPVLLLIPLIGWWIIPIGPAAIYFYSLSGCKNRDKVWRRVVGPICLVVGAMCHTGEWWMIFALAGAIPAMAIGYGLPDPSDPRPSWLGAFIYPKILKNIHEGSTEEITEEEVVEAQRISGTLCHVVIFGAFVLSFYATYLVGHFIFKT